VAGLYVVVSTASLPLTDTIALDYCSDSGFRFAPIPPVRHHRLLHHAPVCGRHHGQEHHQHFSHVLPVLLLAMGACFLVPSTQVKRDALAAEEPKQEKGTGAIREMLRDPVIQFVLVANFTVSLCMSIVGFLPVYASDMGMSTERTA
jgi:hypothetical protein